MYIKHNQKNNKEFFNRNGKLSISGINKNLKTIIYFITFLLLFSTIICAAFVSDPASANDSVNDYDSQSYIGEAISIGTDNAEISNNNERALLRSSSSDSSVNHTITLTGDRLYSEAYKVLDLINTERASVGLPEVSMDSSLMESAMLRAAEAAIYYSHTRPNNTSCFSAITRPYSGAGENLAAVYPSAADVMSGWMNSEGHKANILTSGFTCVGVGVFKIDGIIYWIQIFSGGTPDIIKQPNDCTVNQNITVSENMLNLFFDSQEINVSLKDPIQLTVYNFKDSISIRTHALTSEEFVWNSSDPIIRVNDGEITALGPGSADITVSLGGLTAQCTAVSCMPEQVSGFKALAFDQKVNVSWKASDDADGYYVNAVYSDGTLYKNYSTTKNSVNFADLTNGKTYKFRVRAYELNADGKRVYGKYCSYVSAAPYDDRVQNLKAASYDQKISLSWSAVEDAEGYYIYAMYSDGSKYKTASTTNTSCNFTNLTNGEKYQFKVKEYKKDATGSKVYGSYSKTVAATPLSTGPVVEWNAPTYAWSKGYGTVTATRISKSDPDIKETETVGTTGKVIREATCEDKGVTEYTTEPFINAAFRVQSKTVENISALGHEWDYYRWNWNSDYTGAEATLICSRCGKEDTRTAEVTSEVTKEATEDEPGEIIYTAVAHFEGITLMSEVTEEIPIVVGQVKGLKALAFSEKIRINWQPVDGADGYEIYVDYKDADSYKKYKTYSTSKTYCNFTNLTNGKTYRFKVKAYKTVNGSKVYGDYSSKVSAAPYNDAVKNLKASGYDQKVKLTWSAVKNADGYNIYAMYSDGSKYKTYNTTNTSCNFTKLTNGNKYQFKIREYKVDSTGTKVYASKYSSAVSATPRMDAVSGFKALPFSQKVNVSWDKSDKADGYYINVVYSDGTLYKNYSTTKTYCNFTKLTNGKTYKFRVRAYELNSKGSKVYGKYCSYKSVKPYNDKVTGLKAVPGTNKIALSWTAVDKAEGYNIYAMYADGSKYKTYNTVKTTCNFNNLKSGKTYQFKVREYKKNAAGSKVYGTYSSVVKATAK